MNLKKIVIGLALAGVVATNAQADGRWHGHGGHYGHGGAFFWGAALGAALTLPFYYTRAWADPGPYYYYSPGPTVFVNPPMYVQSQPVYVQSPNYAVPASQPRYAGTPSNGVIELGPVSALPSVSANPAPIASPTDTAAPANQLFAYPSRGQSEQQAANDRFDCSRWATQQSGYDPDLRVHRNPETGPANYARALSACLEGRGYTVR
jgi:hypothetical protein